MNFRKYLIQVYQDSALMLELLPFFLMSVNAFVTFFHETTDIASKLFFWILTRIEKDFLTNLFISVCDFLTNL